MLCVLRWKAFDAIGTTLAWTGMGGTTGPIMREFRVMLHGEETDLMDAWKRGWRHVRMAAPVAGIEFVATDSMFSQGAEDVIATWSVKSWMTY